MEDIVQIVQQDVTTPFYKALKINLVGKKKKKTEDLPASS